MTVSICDGHSVSPERKGRSKEHKSEYARRWHREHREERKAYMEDYNRRYYGSHKDTEEYQDLRRQCANRWHRENREKVSIIKARYRAKKRDLPYTLTQQEAEEILSVGICFYCGTTGGPFVLDHYIPLSRGGGTTKENMRCSCIPCNSSKRDRLPQDFIVEPLEERVEIMEGCH